MQENKSNSNKESMKRKFRLLLEYKLLFILILIDQPVKIIVKMFSGIPEGKPALYFYFFESNPLDYFEDSGFWIITYFAIIAFAIILYILFFRKDKHSRFLRSLLLAAVSVNLIDVIIWHKTIHIFSFWGYSTNLSDIYFNIFIFFIFFLYLKMPSDKYLNKSISPIISSIHFISSISIIVGFLYIIGVNLYENSPTDFSFIFFGILAGLFIPFIINKFYKFIKNKETIGEITIKIKSFEIEKVNPKLTLFLILPLIFTIFMISQKHLKLSMEKTRAELKDSLNAETGVKLLDKFGSVVKSQFLREKPIYKDFEKKNAAQILSKSQLKGINYYLKYKPVIIEVPSNIDADLVIRQLVYHLINKEKRVLVANYENININKLEEMASLQIACGDLLIIKDFPANETDDAWRIFCAFKKKVVCVTKDKINKAFADYISEDRNNKKDTISNYINTDEFYIINIKKYLLHYNIKKSLVQFYNEKKAEQNNKTYQLSVSPRLQVEIVQYPFMVLHYMLRYMYHQDEVYQFEKISQVRNVLNRKMEEILKSQENIDEIIFVLALFNKDNLPVRIEYIDELSKKYNVEIKKNDVFDELITRFARSDKIYFRFSNNKFADLLYNFIIQHRNYSLKTKNLGQDLNVTWDSNRHLQFIADYLRKFPGEISTIMPKLFMTEQSEKWWQERPELLNKLLIFALLHSSSFPQDFFNIYLSYAQKEALKSEMDTLLFDSPKHTIQLDEKLMKKEEDFFYFLKVLKWLDLDNYHCILNNIGFSQWQDVLELYMSRGRIFILGELKESNYPDLVSINESLRQSALNIKINSKDHDYFQYLEKINFPIDSATTREWADFVYLNVQDESDFIRKLQLMKYKDVDKLCKLYIDKLIAAINEKIAHKENGKNSIISEKRELIQNVISIFKGGLYKRISTVELKKIFDILEDSYPWDMLEILHDKEYPGLSKLLSDLPIDSLQKKIIQFERIESGMCKWLPVLDKVGYQKIPELLKSTGLKKLFKRFNVNYLKSDNFWPKILSILKKYNPQVYKNLFLNSLLNVNKGFLYTFMPLPKDFLKLYQEVDDSQEIINNIIKLHSLNYPGLNDLIKGMDINKLLKKKFYKKNDEFLGSYLKLLVFLKGHNRLDQEVLDTFFKIYNVPYMERKLKETMDFSILNHIQQLNNFLFTRLFQKIQGKNLLSSHWESLINKSYIFDLIEFLNILKKIAPDYANTLINNYSWRFYSQLFFSDWGISKHFYREDYIDLLLDFKELGFKNEKLESLMIVALKELEGKNFVSYYTNYFRLCNNREKILNQLKPQLIFNKISSLNIHEVVQFFYFLWKMNYFEWSNHNKELLGLYFQRNLWMNRLSSYRDEPKLLEADLLLLLDILFNVDVKLHSQFVHILTQGLHNTAILEKWSHWYTIFQILYEKNPGILDSNDLYIKKALSSFEFWRNAHLLIESSLTEKLLSFIPNPQQLAKIEKLNYTDAYSINNFLKKLLVLKYDKFNDLWKEFEAGELFEIIRNDKITHIIWLVEKLNELEYPHLYSLSSLLNKEFTKDTIEASQKNSIELQHYFHFNIAISSMISGNTLPLKKTFSHFKIIIDRINNNRYGYERQFWEIIAKIKNDQRFNDFWSYMRNNLQSKSLLKLLFVRSDPGVLKEVTSILDVKNIIQPKAILQELEKRYYNLDDLTILLRNLTEIDYPDMKELIEFIDIKMIVNNFSRSYCVGISSFVNVMVKLNLDFPTKKQLFSYIDYRLLIDSIIFRLSHLFFESPGETSYQEIISRNLVLIKRMPLLKEKFTQVIAYANKVLNGDCSWSSHISNDEKSYRSFDSEGFSYFLWLLKQFGPNYTASYLSSLHPSTLFHFTNKDNWSYGFTCKNLFDLFLPLKESILLLEELSYPRMKEYLNMYSKSYLNYNCNHSIKTPLEREKFSKILKKYEMYLEFPKI